MDKNETIIDSIETPEKSDDDNNLFDNVFGDDKDEDFDIVINDLNDETLFIIKI